MRTVLIAAVVLVAVLLIVVLAAWGFQRRLIYLPDRSEPPLPDVAGLEEVTYPTRDGLELHGWFLAVDDPFATVVVANGNAGNRGNRVPLAQELAARGYAVLLTDYRGYGGNPGSPTEAGVTTDFAAAVRYAAGRPDTDPERLVYFGESLGAAVATALAAGDAPPAALVLRSPFTELADVAAAHYPLPARQLLWDRFPLHEQLYSYDGPVLVAAGARDSIVPTRLSRTVAEDHADTYIEIDGANHNDRALLSGPELLDAVDDFVRAHLPTP